MMGVTIFGLIFTPTFYVVVRGLEDAFKRRRKAEATAAHREGKTADFMKFGVGQALSRKEDDPLIRGDGRYVADLAAADAGHAVVVRSPHAHARFRINDTARAKCHAGRAPILTGADVNDPDRCLAWSVCRGRR